LQWRNALLHTQIMKQKSVGAGILTKEVIVIPFIAFLIVLGYLVYKQYEASKAFQPWSTHMNQPVSSTDTVNEIVVTENDKKEAGNSATIQPLPTSTGSAYYQPPAEFNTFRTVITPLRKGHDIHLMSPDGIEVIARLESVNTDTKYAEVTVDVPSNGDRFTAELCNQEGCSTSLGLDRAYLNGMDIYNTPTGDVYVEHLESWKVM
jgi:hypothetical protein